MRVLLISALPDLDPPCGDVTYTQTLLSNPPDGVVYQSYAEALQNGTLKEHYTSGSVRREWIARGNWLAELGLGSVCKAINKLRDSGFLFAERFRFFSVEPGAYDLIHMHVFHASFANLTCPLVVSAGCPLEYMYADARHWLPARIAFCNQVERSLGQAFKMNLNSHGLPQSSKLLTYTENASQWFAGRKIADKDVIDIVPLYKEPAAKVKQPRPPTKILFVAKDFEAKGGFTLLQAFEKVRGVRPDAELRIIGSEPLLSESEAKARNIVWTSYIPRDELLPLFADYDIFAYPTSFDCISYVLLEAMSSGLAIATSNYPSMPEAVDFGRAGKISDVGDSEGLAQNLIELLKPDVNEHFSRMALEQFNQKYSADVVKEKLLKSYLSCLPI